MAQMVMMEMVEEVVVVERVEELVEKLVHQTTKAEAEEEMEMDLCNPMQLMQMDL